MTSAKNRDAIIADVLSAYRSGAKEYCGHGLDNQQSGTSYQRQSYRVLRAREIADKITNPR